MSGFGGMCGAKTELRWMRFVDGENFTFQGTKFLLNRLKIDEHNIDSSFYKKDQFLWIPAQQLSGISNYHLPSQYEKSNNTNYQTPEAIRSYYYTVVSGNKDTVVPVTEQIIWDVGFTPRVIWKQSSTKKARSVDSSISVDMLSAAYENQFDLVEIWTGDADYIPLINAVKNLGKIVVCCFFDESYGLSHNLKIACDRYCNISEHVERHWSRFINNKSLTQ